MPQSPQGPGNIAGVILGIPEMLISNVTLYQVNILGRGSDGTVSLVNVKDIRIIDSNLTAPLIGTNVLTIYNAQITITNSVVNTNVMTIGGLAKPPTNNVLSLFNARAAITDTNVDGSGSFTLGGSTLAFTQDSVSFSNNLSIVSVSSLAVSSGNNSYAGQLGGSGALTFNLPTSTILTLSGNNSAFSGAMTVSNNGTLLVNTTSGSGALTVLSSAKLGGTGVIGGPTTVNGILAPGSSPGTLTISNNLVVGGTLQYELGSNSDLTVVTGNLTLGGTLNVANAGGFTNTTFTIFAYSGGLAYNGLSIGSAPVGYTYLIDTGTVGQVKLIVSPPLSAFQQWQIQYFGSTTNVAAAADADPDGDGQDNMAEFLSGTNPTNSDSVFLITSTVEQGNDIGITWTTAGGHTNAVQASVGGAGGNYATNFADISSPIIIPGVGDVTTNYTDTGGATNQPSRYYRVRVVP